jgi:hypothetical protein
MIRIDQGFTAARTNLEYAKMQLRKKKIYEIQNQADH